MNIIKPSFEIIEQQPGINGMYKQIELAGRTCYKSEDKITPDSAAAFVDRMIKSSHDAVLEHGTVYLRIPDVSSDGQYVYPAKGKYASNKYSRLNTKWEGPANAQYIVTFVTTNFRVLVENGWTDDLKYICEPTEYHERRICVKFTSDIHFYKDCTRHRVFSWMIESTRFCNYFKERWGASISFARPCWLTSEDTEEFEKDLKMLEEIYFKWIKRGWQPQQAAYFLTQGTKADIIMTGFATDYLHFFDLRSSTAKTGSPHPSVKELVDGVKEEFNKRDYFGFLKRLNQQ